MVIAARRPESSCTFVGESGQRVRRRSPVARRASVAVSREAVLSHGLCDGAEPGGARVEDGAHDSRVVDGGDDTH